MPPTRRKGGGASAASRNAQSTLSFGSKSRVTKPATSIPAKSKKQEVVPEPEVRPVPVAEVPIRQQKVEEVVSSLKAEEDLQAEMVSDGQIEKYWKAEEKSRKAPRVHQEGLSVHEKILRHFDLSSQYGPCIGIPRMKRWKRANKLNLHPPIEVLAVLLKEEEHDTASAQTAYVDRLMSSRYISD